MFRELRQIFVHVTYARGSVLPRRGDTLRTSGFIDDIESHSVHVTRCILCKRLAVKVHLVQRCIHANRTSSRRIICDVRRLSL